jgi:hypothetical protein
MHAQTGSEVHSSSYPVGIEGYFTWRKAAEAWIWARISTSCEVKNDKTLHPTPLMPCHCARLPEVELKIEVVWDTIPCSLVKIDWLLLDELVAFMFWTEELRWLENVPLKSLYDVAWPKPVRIQISAATASLLTNQRRCIAKNIFTLFSVNCCVSPSYSASN